MSDLKLKFKIDEMELELEGESNLVVKLFHELKEEGLGLLSKKTVVDNIKNNFDQEDKEKKPIEKTSEEIASTDTFLSEKLPHLNNIVMEGHPKTEQQWLLVYSLYCSNTGKKFFTDQDLRLKYEESKRATPSRAKNFKTNITKLVASKYIEAINDSDYKITSKGITRAFEIIKDIKKTKKHKNTTKNKSTTISYNMVELNLGQKDRDNLRSYWKLHKHKKTVDKIVLLFNWMKINRDTIELGKDEIYTLLRILDETVSFNIVSALTNAKYKYEYLISSEQKGYYKIFYLGEDHIKNNLILKDDIIEE